VKLSDPPLALFQKQSELGIQLLTQTFRHLADRLGHRIDEERLHYWSLCVVGHARLSSFCPTEATQHVKFIDVHVEHLTHDLFFHTPP